MYELLTQLLSIPNYKVIGIEMSEDTITMEIQSIQEGAKCPRCGTYCKELHENHSRMVRDLPVNGKVCYLRFVRRRFFCPINNKIKLIKRRSFGFRNFGNFRIRVIAAFL